MKTKIIDYIQLALIIFLIIFGLFILYQIILKILGYSWMTESIIIGLLVLVIGFMFTIAVNLVKINLKHDNLERRFNYLAKDFKELKTKINRF